MAQRLNRRSVSFNVLPRDSSGDGETLNNVGSPPAIDKINAGNAHRRRRRHKGRKGSTSHPNLGFSRAGLRYDEYPDDRSLYADSPISDPGGAILESYEKAIGREEVTPPFEDDRVLTDFSGWNRQLSNGSLASSNKPMEADIVLSQLEPSRENNSYAEAIPIEQFEISRMLCISDSSAGRVLVSTREKDREDEQLSLVECRQAENGILESAGGFSVASPHDKVRNLQLLPSLTTAASLRNRDGTDSNGDGVCQYRSTREDLLSPGFYPEEKDSIDIGSSSSGLNLEVQGSMDMGSSSWSVQFPRSGLRQRTAHVLEKDSSGALSEHACRDSVLKNEDIVINKGVSEGIPAQNSEGGNQELEHCDPTAEALPHIPVVHTEHSHLSEWEQLMAGSQPANVAPLKYFLGEVRQARALQNTQSAENDKKRQHVYNTMFHVPWRCELLIIVGFFVCLDSFLSLLTVMPLRFIIFLWRCVLNRRQFRRPRADELSDLCSLLVLVSGVTLLQQADISFIYHMIRSQATIKLYVVYNVLEIFDKLCQSFGSDVLQVVLNSAESVATCSSDLLLFESFRFAMDQCIAVVSFLIHSLIILAQSITVSAALRSHNNALLTLLISNNFAEIKSNVFKRLSKDHLHKLAYLDTVERFHIVAHLFFVLVQNLLASNEPWLLTFASNAAMVLLCEVLVDSIKHAFLAKFNEMKPAAYSEFLQALCRQTLNSQSHDVHKTLSFVPLAPACVVIRVLIPLYAAYLPGAPFLRLTCIVLFAIMTYISLAMLKVLVGLGLLRHASWYVERCRKKEKYFHAD